MKKIIFFDTETTGNETKDFLCQIAYKVEDETFEGLYKPPFKVPPEASAVHHISNKMLDGKPSFKDSGDLEKVKELFEDENSVVVAHNAPFDLMIIEKEGIVPKQFICTLRVARHLDADEKIDRYNLQYLRYLLDLDVQAQAHDALGDVLVLEQLFHRLLKKIMDQDSITEHEAVEEMIEISSHPSIFKKLNFGKHKGKRIEDVVKEDRGWLEWLYAEKVKSDVLDEDWIYTLKHYLQK
ncbi:MAG: exonuclease domain-containing protein [bacterium]|nr:exonuclease domain-containing protein [bacterium]